MWAFPEGLVNVEGDFGATWACLHEEVEGEHDPWVEGDEAFGNVVGVVEAFQGGAGEYSPSAGGKRSLQVP